MRSGKRNGRCNESGDECMECLVDFTQKPRQSTACPPSNLKVHGHGLPKSKIRNHPSRPSNTTKRFGFLLVFVKGCGGFVSRGRDRYWE